MLAVYKRELRAYFSSMIGYVVCAFMMAGTAIAFSYLCLVREYSVFGYVISQIGFLLFILIPILTMKLFADEEKYKTDKLLYSSPVSIIGLVVGKYLAAYTVFSLAVLEMCIFPLIIGKYVETSYAMAYTTILAYWLLGGVLIALGMFISSLTSNSIIAAVLGFVIMLLLFVVSMICDMFSSQGYVSLMAVIILIIAVAALISKLSANAIVPVMACVAMVVAVLIAYVIKPEAFEGLIQSILRNIAYFDKLSFFINGAFDGGILIYYVSHGVLFVFLTIKSLQKKRWS